MTIVSGWVCLRFKGSREAYQIIYQEYKFELCAVVACTSWYLKGTQQEVTFK